MRVHIHGWNKEPAKYGREADEIDLVVEIADENIAFQIEEKLVCIKRKDFAALLRLAQVTP